MSVSYTLIGMRPSTESQSGSVAGARSLTATKRVRTPKEPPFKSTQYFTGLRFVIVRLGFRIRYLCAVYHSK